MRVLKAPHFRFQNYCPCKICERMHCCRFYHPTFRAVSSNTRSVRSDLCCQPTHRPVRSDVLLDQSFVVRSDFCCEVSLMFLGQTYVVRSHTQLLGQTYVDRSDICCQIMLCCQNRRKLLSQTYIVRSHTELLCQTYDVRSDVFCQIIYLLIGQTYIVRSDLCCQGKCMLLDQTYDLRSHLELLGQADDVRSYVYC